MTSTVALVFVSTNEGEVLNAALDSVFKAERRHPTSVVVVDNVSTDGIEQSVPKTWPEVRVLRRHQRMGLPSNLNFGIENTHSDYVMLCNSDIVVAPDAIDLLADFLDSHPRAGVVGPRLLDPQGRTRPSARRWYSVPVLISLKGPWQRFTTRLRSVQLSTYQDWDYSEPRVVDWVPCPATLVRRAALDEIGLMDERFRLYFDDVDLSLRMHEAGWEVWCLPQAEIVHIEQRSSVRPLSRAWRWHLQSLVKFALKHKGLRPSTHKGL